MENTAENIVTFEVIPFVFNSPNEATIISEFTNNRSIYGIGEKDFDVDNPFFIIPTPQGKRRAYLGDYIAKEANGDLSVLRFKHVEGEDFKVGDVVRHTNGNLPMTVEAVTETTVSTAWFKGDELYRDTFQKINIRFSEGQ